jgi:hypothetical protein
LPGNIRAIGPAIYYAQGISFDNDDNAIISIQGTGDVKRITPLGNQTPIIQGLTDPHQNAVDSLGNIYVTNTGAGQLVKFSTTAGREILLTGLTDPQGLAFDSQDNLYIASNLDRKVFKYSSGILEEFVDISDYPFQISINSLDNIYVLGGQQGIVTIVHPVTKNKTVVIPNDSWNLLKAHGTSALSSLGNKLIGKGFKQMRVGDMRRFVKAYKRAKYGEKMTGGARLGKKELVSMMKPMMEDDDLDEMVGGSVWTDFVKEFSSRHSLKYACSLSKYKEPLKKAYKLKKEGKDWYSPLKETREMSVGMEGGNKWTDFVKDYAKKYDTTYGCALSDMGTKNAYKLFKDGQPWYFPKTKEMDTQTDFVEPEPVKAPEDIKPLVGRIEEKLVKLEEMGRKKGAVHYDARGIVGSIAFVNLMKKYGGKCIVSGVVDSRDKIRVGFELDSRSGFSTILYDTKYPELGKQLKECVDRGVKLICIPLTIYLNKAQDAHANMIVYRPFQRLVERFDPHGSVIDYDTKVNDSINRQLKKLFEKELQPWIGEVRFKDAEDICPSSKGFQALEGQLEQLAQEGGGFCMMWSNFLAEMTLLNPMKPTKEIVDEVFELTKRDPSYVKSVIRGYTVEVESELDTLLKTLGKSGFSFESGDATKLEKERKDFEPWLLSIIFETKQQSEPQGQYDKLPPKMKKEKEKKEKDYEEKLKSFTKEQLNNLMSLYGVKLEPMSKEDMITNIVFLYNTGEMKKYGASSIKDIDRIIAEKLHKKEGAYKHGLAKDGYFTK